MVSDEILLIQFQAGSQAAMEELFARYRDPVYAFFYRRVDGSTRAEDLIQETFLAIVRGIVRYEPRSSVRSYLFGIAYKVLLSERRKHKKNSEPFLVGEEPWIDRVTDAALWVREALAKLDANDREILMLREYEQLSYGEIAELLQLPLNTVRSRLFRSRMALKQHLEPQTQRSESKGGGTCK